MIALCVSMAGFAQVKRAPIPAQLKNLKATRSMHTTDNSMNLSNNASPYVQPPMAKSVNETQLGTTRYDLQTNQSVQNRIYLHPDGTIGAMWSFGQVDPNFADRGGALNYFDGSSWGAYPTARIEGTRVGWPSYAPMGTGELVCAHNSSTGLVISRRDPKGTGAWTDTVIQGPLTSDNTTALLWPRMITSGNTVHIIACTDQALTGDPAITYQGLELALVYIRSTDGGHTWDAPIILPGMDSASVVSQNNKGFGGDSYSWAAPKGDTIAFVVGDSWSDFFVMKSFDGGDTWTKIMIYDFPTPATAPTTIIPSLDGSSAIAIDDMGKVHVVVGKMRVSDDTYTDDLTSYYPYTDGLIYWNEDIGQIDSNALSYTSDSMLIAVMYDFSGNDTIDFPTVGSGQWPFGNYYLSLTSMPQIIIDGSDIYVTFSSVREDKSSTGANPNEQLYRHVFAMKSNDLGQTWSNYNDDLTQDVLHDFDECVFASLSYTSDNMLHIVYQADEEPGLAVRGDEDPYTDNRIYYIGVEKALVGVSNVGEAASAINNVKIYPNPVSETAKIDITLSSSQKVDMTISNIMGQLVTSKSFGTINAGTTTVSFDASSLQSGIYFCTVNAGTGRTTSKIVVK